MEIKKQNIKELNLKIEKQISETLNEYKFFKYTKDWRVNLDLSHKISLDFYIYFPFRGFIEIFYYGNDQQSIVTMSKLEQIKSIYYSFQEEVIPILVGPQSINKVAKDFFGKIPFLFIEFSPKDTNAGRKIAAYIRNSYVHQKEAFAIRKFEELQKNKKSGLKEVKDKVGIFDDILLSFRPFIAVDNFNILEEEIGHFYKEFETQHYTTAALRIGRTLEFILYTLSNDWGIQVNKVAIKKIGDLKLLFNSLEDRLVDYINSSTKDKLKYRKILQKKNNEILQNINNLIFDIDNHQVESTEVPLNPNSLIRDIKYGFSQHEVIRKEINIILDEKLVDRIIEKRNAAAHADTSGKRRELEEAEVVKMIEDLRTLMFHLCNVASNLKKLNSNA